MNEPVFLPPLNRFSMNYKSHFPIFTHHPNLVYLDSASTTQKPGVVIAAQSQFLEQSYANIHR
jgi:cysteine desulfurase / selenocysteine lyase